MLYMDGAGVGKDLVHAYAWFSLSASRGDVDGLRYTGEFQNQHLLTTNQFAEAEALVLALRDQISTNSPVAR